MAFVHFIFVLVSFDDDGGHISLFARSNIPLPGVPRGDDIGEFTFSTN